MKQVIKRDGRKETFNNAKIIHAVSQAFKETDEELSQAMLDKIITRVNDKLKDTPSVEDIQDAVELALQEFGFYDVAKAYILYRDSRTKVRELSKNLTQTFKKIVRSDAKDNDFKRENANIDGNAPMGMMLKFGSEAAKDFNLKYLIRPEIALAHKNGDIHIHKVY